MPPQYQNGEAIRAPRAPARQAGEQDDEPERRVRPVDHEDLREPGQRVVRVDGQEHGDRDEDDARRDAYGLRKACST